MKKMRLIPPRETDLKVWRVDLLFSTQVSAQVLLLKVRANVKVCQNVIQERLIDRSAPKVEASNSEMHHDGASKKTLFLSSLGKSFTVKHCPSKKIYNWKEGVGSQISTSVYHSLARDVSHHALGN
jgi:hypothetical protein